MAKSWLVDCRGIAKKVRHATLSSSVQNLDCGAKRECPKCHHWIDNSDVTYEWPGLPAGVKFDPTDAELLEHLAAKCGSEDAKPPHVFVDEFIPTLETDKGICYTHPKYLPGASKDGTSIHFFHKTANAYASGQRKRRKIETEENEKTVRWHKTGKTKPVLDNCVQKGCKKIMVLYSSSVKGSKPVKSNWVMHQYHLGTDEDEREGEYVVSKIFYQQNKLNDIHDDEKTAIESLPASVNCPKTPMTQMPNPPRAGDVLLGDDATDDCLIGLKTENQNRELTGNLQPPTEQYEEVKPQVYLAGEPQALDSNVNDDSLRCNEILNSFSPFENSIAHGFNNIDDAYGGSFGFPDLDNIELDSPPDFQDLQFGSQDSILSWLDRL
ncbi:SUPPRESSOR OF GAMMA RESPONSE 1-like [Silene latifolia]|uniref:SUPPRESSOR OF GAMMA RESPONSE 1-like n=1 Tax=Silene latifolia TaxID=37657 RepID=UPI003D789E26